MVNNQGIFDDNFKLIKKVLDKGLFHLLFSNMLVQFLAFGLILFLAKFLSPQEVGNLRLIQSWGAFFIMLGAFGYNIAAVKICSESRDLQEIKQDLMFSIKRVALFSCLSCMAMLAFNNFYLIPSRPELSIWPNVYAFSILFGPMGLLFLAFLQARKEVKLAAQLQASVRIIFVFIIFLAAWQYGYVGVIFGILASYFFGVLVYLPKLKSFFVGFGSNPRAKRIDKYALAITLGSFVTVIGQFIDTYILGYLGAPSEVIGRYAVASLFFLAGTAITGTVQSVVTPYFSEKQHDLQWVRERTFFYQKKLMLFTIPISIILIAGSFLLVKYYFGIEYEQSFDLSLFLIGKYFVWSSYCILGASLFALGVVKEGIYITALILLINTVLSEYLYNAYGVFGIAAAQIISGLLTFMCIYPLFLIKTKVVSE